MVEAVVKSARRLYLASAHASEDAEQEALFRWLELARWRGVPLVSWYWHTPNGGSRNVVEAMKLKRMGVKRGVPDVFGAIAVGGYHGHFVEMKAHGGTVEKAQRELHELLRAGGYRVDVCFGWDEGRTAIERYVGRAGAVQERGA